MAITRFEDIIAWQKAQDLSVYIYSLFSTSKDFDFKNQICRASVSISSNIAEGFDRSSSLDFKRFFNIGRSSYNEVKSLTYLAFRLKYINEAEKNKIISDCTEISKIMLGLIKVLQSKSMKS